MDCLKLKERRIEKELTRPELAEMVGVNWETIKSYEARGTTPSLPVAIKLAEALETTVEDLFEGLEAEKPTEE